MAADADGSPRTNACSVLSRPFRDPAPPQKVDGGWHPGKQRNANGGFSSALGVHGSRPAGNSEFGATL
jgi:hypothetical protein